MGESRREVLHGRLKEIMGDNPVYFQEPPNDVMRYPCIVYELDSAETVFADDKPYRITPRYTVTVIDEDPDSAIRDKVSTLPGIVLSQAFKADNLNHYAFTLFF